MLEKIRGRVKMKMVKVNKEGRERWWDEDCRLKKREVR